MPTGYQIQEQDKAHYITLQIVEWADVFTRKTCRNVFLESLHYCMKHKRLEVFTYVIMSNHVHLIVRSSTDDLSGAIRDLKKVTTKRIIEFATTKRESRRKWMLRLFRVVGQATPAQPNVPNLVASPN